MNRTRRISNNRGNPDLRRQHWNFTCVFALSLVPSLLNSTKIDTLQRVSLLTTRGFKAVVIISPFIYIKVTMLGGRVWLLSYVEGLHILIWKRPIQRYNVSFNYQGQHQDPRGEFEARNSGQCLVRRCLFMTPKIYTFKKKCPGYTFCDSYQPDRKDATDHSGRF